MIESTFGKTTVGGVGAALLGLTVLASPAQANNERVLYYLMLKGLESQFEEYREKLESQYQVESEKLIQESSATARSIEEELIFVEERRRQGVDSLNRRADVLNHRISRLNRAISEYNAGKTLDDALAQLEKIRDLYQQRLRTLQQAQARFSAAQASLSGDDSPLAQSIKELWQVRAKALEEKQKQLQDLTVPYAQDYASYVAWVKEQEREVARLRAAAEDSLTAYQSTLGRHEALRTTLVGQVNKFNALVMQLNEDEANAPFKEDAQGDARERTRAELRALEASVGQGQVELEAARLEVTQQREELTALNQRLGALQSKFLAEKSRRERALSELKQEVDETRAEMEKRFEQRMAALEEGMAAQERAYSAELRRLREKMNAARVEMEQDFGIQDFQIGDFETGDFVAGDLGTGATALGAALEHLKATRDSSLLYRADGTARFDTAKPLLAALYDQAIAVATTRALARMSAEVNAEMSTAAVGVGGPSLAEGLLAERTRTEAAIEGLRTEHEQVQSEYEARRKRLTERQVAHGARSQSRVENLRSQVSQTSQAALWEFEEIQRTISHAARGQNLVTLSPARPRPRRSNVDATLSLNASLTEPLPLSKSFDCTKDSQESSSPYWPPGTGSGAVRASQLLPPEAAGAFADAWWANTQNTSGMEALVDALSDQLRYPSRSLGLQVASCLFQRGLVSNGELRVRTHATGDTSLELSVIENRYRISEAGSLESIP